MKQQSLLISLLYTASLVHAHQITQQDLANGGARINHAGVYSVAEDLFYDGDGAAITVASSGVTLDFAGHALDLANANHAIESGGHVGVLVEPNLSDISISGGTIKDAAVPAPASGWQFKLKHPKDPTANTFYDLSVPAHPQALIPGHLIPNEGDYLASTPVGAGILLEGSDSDVACDITISDMKVAHCFVGIAARCRVQHFVVERCTGISCGFDYQGIVPEDEIRYRGGFIITQHRVGDASGFDLDNRFGEIWPEEYISDGVVIRDCLGYGANSAARGVSIGRARGVLIEGCTMDVAVNNSISLLEASGFAAVACQDVVIKNCQALRGAYGFHCKGSKRCTLLDCHAHQNNQSIALSTAKDILVRNCTAHGGNLAGSYTRGTGITTALSENVIFDSCIALDFTRAYGQGFGAFKSDNITFTNCLASNCIVGFHAGPGENMLVTNCQAYNNIVGYNVDLRTLDFELPDIVFDFTNYLPQFYGQEGFGDPYGSTTFIHNSAANNSFADFTSEIDHI